jgi:hypothetical protein
LTCTWRGCRFSNVITLRIRDVPAENHPKLM